MRAKIYLVSAVYVFLPICCLALASQGDIPDAVTIVLIAICWLPLLITGRSDIFGYWLRPILLVLILASFWIRFGPLTCLLMAGVLCIVWSALRRTPIREKTLDLSFPFQGGVYYVGHGGANSVLNHHYPVVSQRYALDILLIGWTGLSARGIMPTRLNSYYIFGEPVVSPCDGIVTGVEQSLDDLPPLCPFPDKPAGNHVVIRYEDSDVYVGLAHLMKGSLAVSQGDKVRKGQIIGKVGNSGNSFEPHLHIHAKRGGSSANMLDGVGVPITFRNRWLVRNSLFFQLRKQSELGSDKAHSPAV